MSPEHWNRIRELFHSALEQEAAPRRAFLDLACSGDPDTRAEVEALLAAHESDPTFLEWPVSCSTEQFVGAVGHIPPWFATRHDSTETVPDVPDRIPERIGQFRIERMIASGGMGTVYQATQEHPRRVVALKLMKQGIASRSALRRFEYEGQILAHLRHSGIAQIFEAGAHRDENGATPFFAMEFIPNAKPITTFARENNLSIKKRLEMFVQLCEAVHHGHQKGVIHRDLKPGNILVDSSGHVKIIDFGVARCTDSDLAITTLQTDVGQLIGTLQYMSPEQCEADPHDIDSRSDVYALGVVLYELVTDRLPYDVSRKVLHEATRMIREERPARPSTIRKALRGDIETITLKALEKDRDRRYQTAGDLAADLKRFLADEPIEAKRDIGAYLLRMFVRRHRVAAVAAMAFVALLGVSSITLAYMYSKQVQLRELALRREEETRQVVKFQAAQLAGIDANAMGRGLRSDILRMAGKANRAPADGERGTTSDTGDLEERIAGVNFTDVALHSLEENILKRSAQAINEQFKEQPKIRARLFQTLAETSAELGLLQSAMTYETEALDLRRRILGEEHPATLTSLQGMGYVYRLMGKFDEAMSCYQKALESRRRILGNDHPDTLQSIESVGYVLQWTGRLKESLTYRNEALDGFRRLLGDERPETLDELDAMCSLLMSMKQYNGALPYCEEAMKTKRRILGSDTYRTMISISNMGVVLKYLGQPRDALPYSQEALNISRKILGDDHPNTLMSINNIGTLLLSMGRFDEAMVYYNEALDRRRRVLGVNHRDTLTSLHNMGYLLRSMGRSEEALHYFEQARDGRQRVLGADDPDTQRSARAVASLLRDTGRVPDPEHRSSQSSDPTGD